MKKKLFVAGTALIILLLALPSIAPGQENRSRRFAPGVCGPADPSYLRIAEETGGIPMFLLPTEISVSTKLILIRSSSNAVTVLWAKGAGSTELVVPLDSTLEQVSFTLSTDTHGTTMEVIAPSGAAIAANGAGAQVDDLNCGRVIILTRPSPGAYSLRVRGSGRFWLAVEGKSEIFLHAVRFVEVGGRPGHEGYFPIAGQPLAGKPATLEASIAGTVKEASFSLVSVNNAPLRPLEMKPVDSDRGQYFGTLDLPDSPFRVRATGTDQNGYPYQRVFHTLFRGATSAILPQDKAGASVPPGTAAVFSYVVQNLGGTADFRIHAFAGGGFEVRVEPSELKLEAGASAKIQVSVTIPATAEPGAGFDLTVSVSNIADPAVFNGNSRHLSVSGSQ